MCQTIRWWTCLVKAFIRCILVQQFSRKVTAYKLLDVYFCHNLQVAAKQKRTNIGRRSHAYDVPVPIEMSVHNKAHTHTHSLLSSHT